MSTNLYSRLACDPSYKLVQLSPDLLEALSDDEPKLQFKSFNESKSDVVICSAKKSWIIRQKNHSNTVMLMREFLPEQEQPIEESALFGMPRPINDLLGYSRTTFEYETRPIEGRINLDLVPIYNGDINFANNDPQLKGRTLRDVFDNSPSSELECRLRWNFLGGCVINGCPCILSRDLLSNALHVTLMSALAESLDFNKLRPLETFEAVQKDVDNSASPYVLEVIKTVLAKFGTTKDNETWKLNRRQVAEWYGIRALQKFASKQSAPLPEFLIKWKSTFPPFAPFDIDIKMLQGWFFEPIKGNVQYVSKDSLPIDAKDRFKMLFKLQSQWDLDAFAPFVEDLNTKGLKIDTFIMKYARKRRIGKRIVVCSRTS